MEVPTCVATDTVVEPLPVVAFVAVPGTTSDSALADSHQVPEAPRFPQTPTLGLALV